MLTHTSIATNLAQLEPFIPMGPGDRILAVLPFFHIYGLTALMNAPLRQERHRRRPAPLRARRLPARHPGTPRQRPVRGPADRPRPRQAPGRRRPRPVLPGVRRQRRRPARRRPRRGLLEAARTPAGPAGVRHDRAVPGHPRRPPRRRDAPPGTVGRLLPSTEMRILSLDDPAKDAAPGEEGEIAIRGPQVMKGYLGRPDATAAMIDAEGWVHTGDVGRVDEDGWLFVVDRVKELIKYKGFQVAPAELEALLPHPRGHRRRRRHRRHRRRRHRDPQGLRRPPALRARPHRRGGRRARRRARLPVQEGPRRGVRRHRPRAASGKILRRELRQRS